MSNILSGKKVSLRPATLDDRASIFQWLAHSNLTKEMIGPPKYPDSEIPTWEAFIQDYVEFFFDGSQPLNGRCFIIEKDGLGIGQINYNEIDISSNSTFLDIWLSDRKYTGKGYGTEAIELLCNFLKVKFGCKEIMLCPSKRNTVAIQAYEKAGFIMTDRILSESERDYIDNVVMVKNVE